MRWCPTAVCIKKYCVTNFLAGRSNPGRGRMLFAFPNVQADSEAHTSTYSLDTFPWAKWIGRKVDHSPPPSAEYKHEWSHTSIPPHVFMTWVGTTLRLPLFEFTEDQDTVISTVVCIRRSGVNRGQIQRVLEDMGSEYDSVAYSRAVRWLSLQDICFSFAIWNRFMAKGKNCDTVNVMMCRGSH